MKVISGLHARLGDFWWWSICLFVALRIGDVINAVVGLWLVPKYVGQEELGAVLPLLQVSSVFGLPISILVLVFMKFLNRYKTNGEDGKVKSLMRTFWLLASACIVLGCFAAAFLLPHFFDRIRVVSGSLGILIMASAVLSSTSPVFSNALQALKRFRSMAALNILSAPLRLVVMLVAMPFRALSGYMLGQIAPSVLHIGWSIVALRKDLGRAITTDSSWRHDIPAMIRYTICVALWMGAATIVAMIQAMIIRQRLPEVESAAYYMISRFAELATYAGLTLSTVMFPFAAEAHTRGKDSARLLHRMTIATIGFGLLFAGGLAIFGRFIFELSPLWSAYVGYVPDMVLLALVLTLGMAVGNFCSHQAARDDFSFLWFVVPLSAAQAAFYICFTGYGFFNGILPQSVVDWMESLRIASLRNILWTMCAFTVFNTIGAALVCWSGSKNTSHANPQGGKQRDHNQN